jgi:SOS-response transcriptional repressor LexA
MMKTALTPKQKEVLEYLVQYTFENLYQPSLREMCDHFKMASTNAMSTHLRALVTKEYIVMSEKCSRAIQLKDKSLHFVKSSDYLRAKPIILDGLVK